MSDQQKSVTGFAGTYFDKDSVLRLSRYMVILGWVMLAIYLLDWGYSTYQTIVSSIMGGYPLDFFFLFISTPSRPLQGLMLLFGLQAVSKGLLILLDIEDNTRRAARNAAQSGK